MVVEHRETRSRQFLTFQHVYATISLSTKTIRRRVIMGETFVVIDHGAMAMDLSTAISIKASTIEDAVEKLGANLGDPLKGRTKGWNLKIPPHAFEQLTKEMDSGLYSEMINDLEHWPGGCYVYQRAGVILALTDKESLDRGLPNVCELYIIQPQVF